MLTTRTNRFPMLILLALGLLFVLLLSARTPAEAATVVVDGNGNGDFTSIQDAIDNANEGDTLRVWEGRYTETIVVDKTLIIEGNGTQTSIIDGGGAGSVVNITADQVNLSGFRIEDAGSTGDHSGIWLGADWCHLSKLYLPNNRHGIYLYQAQSNNITEVNVSGSEMHGVYFTGSSNNMMDDSSVYQSKYLGVWLDDSSDYNIVLGNTVLESGWNGFNIADSSYNNFEDNEVMNNGWNGFNLLGGSSHNALRDN